MLRLMGGRRITQTQRDHYWTLRAQGWSIARSAKECGFSLDAGKAMERDKRDILGDGEKGRLVTRAWGSASDYPIPEASWGEATVAALADRTGFLFCKRYFGFELSAWQQNFWRALEEAWLSPDREYMCVNVGPGYGKSTVMVMFAAKVTVLRRKIRGMFLSRTHILAQHNTMRLRRALERVKPFTNAESTLAVDFGRFRARQGETWRAVEFVVEQFDGELLEEKEPTWAAYGFDAEWLGNRLDVILGDDLDSTRSLFNMEIVERNWDIFDNELEPRLDSGGLMVVAQQRLSPVDFSAHVLGKQILPDDDGITENPEGILQYKHVIYKAHYEDLCKGVDTHKHGSPGWPDGCLLDPRLRSYRDLRSEMRKGRNFQVVFQQEDMTAQDALVQKVWVNGGRDEDGNMFIGCWDPDRQAWELPHRADGSPALEGEVLGIMTVDPSPTKFWAVAAWAYHPASQQRFLLDLHREKMEAPDFLDWSSSLNTFTGLAEDWRFLFDRAGVRMSHVIVEINAAQRFMLQYQHFHRWMREKRIEVTGHSTQRNKSDPEYGVQMLASIWKFGQIRLPGSSIGHGKVHALRLVDEVLRYPNSTTTDCIMAQWFLEFAIPRLYVPAADASIPKWRPSWMRGNSGLSQPTPAR